MKPESIKKWFLFLSAAFLCFISVVFGYGQIPEEHPMYTLSVYNGKIAVFENGNPTPKEILDTSISALPASDAARLYAGITAHTEEELQKMIEDYCS